MSPACASREETKRSNLPPAIEKTCCAKSKNSSSPDFVGGRENGQTCLEVIRRNSYFFNELVIKNCTVTLRPIGKDRVLSSKSITASRTSRSLLSDGSPVEMLFLPIIADILTTDPLSFFRQERLPDNRLLSDRHFIYISFGLSPP